MKRICMCEIGADPAGGSKEISPFSNAPDSCIKNNHYWQKEPDPEHPSSRIKVCGNCMHFIIEEIP